MYHHNEKLGKEKAICSVLLPNIVRDIEENVENFEEKLEEVDRMGGGAEKHDDWVSKVAPRSEGTAEPKSGTWVGARHTRRWV